MIRQILTVPDHIRKRIASALETGLLAPPYSEPSLRSVLGIREGSEAVSRALTELGRLGLSSQASAAWIRTMEEAVSHIPRPDFVWSGPEVAGLHARDTRRVFEELLSTAKESVWISTFVFFDGPKAFEILARRMGQVPTLRVFLLLNIQRKHGDTTVADQLVRRFADHFWKTDWPGSSRPLVYYDPRSLEPDGPSGVLHAKAVVTDDEAVFITSANLTEAALDRNIEMGLFIRDRALATTVVSHFHGLIDQKLLCLLPTQ